MEVATRLRLVELHVPDGRAGRVKTDCAACSSFPIDRKISQSISQWAANASVLPVAFLANSL